MSYGARTARAGGASAFNPETAEEEASEYTLTARDGAASAVVRSRLEGLCALGRGWDGYVAPPVSFKNAYFAMELLDSIGRASKTPPRIIPGVRGDLQLEWEVGDFDIELHVEAPYKVNASLINTNTDEVEEILLRNNFKIVADWLRESGIDAPTGPAAAE